MAPSTSAFTALSRAAASASTSCAKTASQTRFVLGRRTFTSLPTLRPRLPGSQPAGVFRTGTSSSPSPLLLAPSAETSAAVTPDLVPRGAVTAHPALAGAQQVRFGPRPTMARSSRLVRKRRHGFLSRVRTRTGRRTLQHRRSKGRHTLSN